MHKTIAVGVALLAVLAASGNGARAADTRTEAAREHSRQGDAYYKLEKYTNAISEYELAYLSKPDPSFLFNIAQCHRLMGHGPEAIKFYRRFLNDAPPGSPSRGVAEKHIRDLEDTARSTAAEPPATTPGPVTPLPSAAPPAAPATPGPPTTGAGSTSPVGLEATNPTSPSTTTPLVENSSPPVSDDQKPFYYKWWFWTAVGAVVATGIVIGLVASRHDPACPELTTCR